MEVVVARCAGLDVHKKTVTACVRTPGSDGDRDQEVREFSTYTADLRGLRDWLVSCGVTQVAMEATGVYWRPVWHVLKEASRLELLLVNAHHVKKVPGRKTDVADACWLAQLLECGLLRGSFVPPRVIARLRDLTWYRKKLIQERARETQRIQKLLEDAVRHSGLSLWWAAIGPGEPRPMRPSRCARAGGGCRARRAATARRVQPGTP